MPVGHKQARRKKTKIQDKNNIKKTKKGFTLVELLAVIVIFSIVIAIGSNIYLNVIKSSKDNSTVIAMNNLKEAAYLYGRENKGEKYWNTYEDETGKKRFICMTVNELINNGYFNSKFYNKDIYKNKINDNTIIKMTQNENYSDLNVEILHDSSWDQCESAIIPPNLQFTKNVDIYSDRIIFHLPHFEASENQIITNYRKFANENEDKYLKCNESETGIDCQLLHLKNNTKYEYNIKRELIEEITEDNSSIEEAEEPQVPEEPTEEIEKTNITKLEKIFNDKTLDMESPIIGANKIDDINNIYNIGINFSNKNIYDLKGKHYFKSTITGTTNLKVLLCNTTNPDYNTSCTAETNTVTKDNWYLVKDTNGKEKIEINIKTPSLNSLSNTTQHIKAKTIDESKNQKESDEPIEIKNIPLNCFIKYNMNGGTNNQTNPTKYAEKSNISISTPPIRAGYTFVGWTSQEWSDSPTNKKIKLDKCYPENNPLVITANWRANTITIKYNVNGGTITPKTTSNDGTTYNWTIDTSGYIKQNGKEFKTTFNYGDTDIDLPNYNNANYLNITKPEYTGFKGKEWKISNGSKTYDQAAKYKANDFCDATNEDCVANLTVNWSLTPTSCLINLSGTVGGAGYYTSNVTAKLDKRTTSEITAVKYGLATSINPTNMKETYTQTADTNGTTLYGYVELSNGAKINCSKTIKKDTTKPTCSVSGGSSSWINTSRTIKATCSDNGSGCATATFSKKYDTQMNITNAGAKGKNSGGSVKDNAGNTANCPANQTVKIDTTKPTCTNSGDSKNWQKTNRTINYGCSDTGGSGCNSSAKGGSKTFTTTTKTATIAAYTIKDNAGNSYPCPKRTANVYVDKTAPTMKWVSSGGNESIKYSSSITIRMAYSDSHSGIKTWQAYSYARKNSESPCCNSGWKDAGNELCKKSCNDKANKVWRAYRSTDKATNKSVIICTYYSNNKVTKKTGTASSCTVNGYTFKG